MYVTILRVFYMLYRETVPEASRFLVILANPTIVNTKKYTLAK